MLTDVFYQPQTNIKLLGCCNRLTKSKQAHKPNRHHRQETVTLLAWWPLCELSLQLTQLHIIMRAIGMLFLITAWKAVRGKVYNSLEISVCWGLCT